MTEVDILEEVKTRLGVTGDYQDDTLQGYIDDVTAYLTGAGVSNELLESKASVGVIARGVADMWNLGAGDGQFSTMFFNMASQLVLRGNSVPKRNAYSRINKVKDYLFELWYDKLDYENAYTYFEKNEDPINIGACSSVRNGNWYGRNLDWTYDNMVEFIVHIPHIQNRYASIGIASGFSELTNDYVKSNKYNDLYKIVPFQLYDGINECGLIANVNVVPLDKGKNKAVPTGVSQVSVSASMLIRYVLDNFASAADAVDFIEKRMTVYFPIGLHDLGYECHYMIADSTSTYLVEFIENRAVVTEMDKPYMTNFYLSDVTFNANNKVYTPADVEDGHLPSEVNNITSHGSGLERYNLIVDHYANANTKNGMRRLMNKLLYTRSYQGCILGEADPFWFTEYVGENHTVDTPLEDYAEVVNAYGEIYKHRSRDDATNKTWQTVHSSIYDIENKKLYLMTQEDGIELEFKIEQEV